MLTVTAIGLSVGVLPIAACTHTTDRAVEPAGMGDASAPTPDVADAALSPLTPIALPPEPRPTEDYRMVRAPEFGQPAENSGARFELTGSPADLGGGAGGSSGTGMAGNDLRPVAAGGHSE